MRYLSIFLTLLFIASTFSCAGRPNPLIKEERIYQTDKTSRKLMFIEFKNNTGKPENNYLKKSIPQTLYRDLKGNKRIKIPENDLILSWNNFNSFITHTYTHSLSNGRMHITPSNEIPNLPVYFVETNVISEKEFQVIYRLGASNVKYINARFDKRYKLEEFSKLNQNNPHYIEQFEIFDTNMIISNERLFTNVDVIVSVNSNFKTNFESETVTSFIQTNVEISIETNTTNLSTNITYVQTNFTNSSRQVVTNTTNLLEMYVTNYSTNYKTVYQTNYEIATNVSTNTKTNTNVSLFVETDNYYRQLDVHPQVAITKTNTLVQILNYANQQGADFAVFGQLNKAEGNFIQLRVFLIKTYKSTVELIYDKKIASHKMFEGVAVLPGVVLSAIQLLKGVANISFDSSLPDTYVYIEDQFVGKTPMTLFVYPEGKYSLSLWHPQGEIDIEKTLKKNRLVSNNFLLKKRVIRKKTTYHHTINIDSNLDNSTNYFYFKKKEDTGIINIVTDKGSNTVLHIDAKLSEEFDTNAQIELATGQHFLVLSNKNYELLKMLVPVKKDTITDVNVMLKPKKIIPEWKRPSLNYALNKQIFGAIGATLFFAAIINGILYNDSIVKREALRQSGQINTPAYDYYNQKQFDEVVSLYTVGSLSLLSLVTSLTFRILEVKDNVTPLLWEGSRDKYFKIKFIKRY